MNKYINTTFKFLAVLLFATSMQLVFSAPSIGGIGMQPVRGEDGSARHFFEYVISEGGETRDEAVIINQANETVTVAFFSSTQTVEDDKIIEKEVDPRALPDPGIWITFDEQIVTIPANGQRVVGFSINLPENADVGEHEGALLVTELMGTSKRKGGTGFSVRLQVGAKIVVNVPGDIHREFNINKISHKIGRVDGRPLRFIFNVTNGGNVSLRPTLDTKIRGIFGNLGELNDIEVSSIVRGETTDIDSLWKKRAPYFGRFVADFKFHLGEHIQYNKDETTTLLPDEIIEARYVFWIVPGIEILYVLLVILLLYLLRSLWLYLIISRRLRTKTETYKVAKNDTLTGIASKYGVDPRVLAKFNMMRWPYEVKVGDKLLVPVGRLEMEEWQEQSRTMLKDREIMGGILGHLFRSKKVHHMTRNIMTDVTSDLPKNTEILVAEKGDTVSDVASFAGIELQVLIDINNLRPPYRLRVGQELIVPKKEVKPRKKKIRKKKKDK